MSPSSPDRCVLSVLAVLVALIAVYFQRQADADLWGHLQYGQLFLDNGSNIAADPYAYTTTGQHWSTHEYLAQMALALAYRWAGPGGLIALKCLLGAAAIACLYACLRSCTPDPRLWGPLLMLSAIGLGRWYQFRPQLFTYLFLAFFVLILFRYLLEQTKALWLLPLLMPLWVNLHGGFLAGLGAVGLALAGRLLQTLNRDGLEPKKLWSATWPLLLTLAGCFAGSLCNPLGWQLYAYLKTEFGHTTNGRYLQEWQPVSAVEQPWTIYLLALLLGLLILLTVLAQLRTREIAHLAPWQWLLSCLPVTVMALLSQRHIPILTIWATPVLGLLAQAAAADAAENSWWSTLWLGITGLIAPPAVIMISAFLHDPGPGITIDGSALGPQHPHGLMAFLQAHQLEGKLFTPLWWGSYFTLELYPKIQVSMDGRNVTLFRPQDVTDNLVFYHEKDADLDIPFKDGREPNFLVVPADTPVLPRVRQDSRWLLAHEDSSASLFVRNTPTNRANVVGWQRQPLSEEEQAIPRYLRASGR